MAEAKQIDFLLAGIRNPETDEPLSGGAVYCYEAGTSTAVNLYIARDTTEGPATNPVILDAEGKASVFGNGVYKFVIRDQADESAEIIYEVDGVEYKAIVTASGSIGPLTSDLDAAGYKIKNVGTGSEAGDVVEWQQWQNNIDALEAAISAVQTNVDEQTFLKLGDTPASYSGAALRIPRVNTGETAIEFVDPQTAVTKSFLQLTDTPGAYTGEAGKAPLVNAGESGLIFGFPDAKTIQGVDVDSTPPIDGQILRYDGGTSKYIPATPSTSGSIVRTVAFSGATPTVTISAPTDYPGTAWLVSVTHNTNIVSTFDPAVAAALGYVRLLNRGGENADRNYDFIIYVSKGTGESYTFTTGLIQRIVVLSQI